MAESTLHDVHVANPLTMLTAATQSRSPKATTHAPWSLRSPNALADSDVQKVTETIL